MDPCCAGLDCECSFSLYTFGRLRPCLDCGFSWATSRCLWLLGGRSLNRAAAVSLSGNASAILTVARCYVGASVSETVTVSWSATEIYQQGGRAAECVIWF